MAISNILFSDNLDLVPFDERFLTERYVSWLNDKQTMQYSEQRHRQHTLKTCRKYAAAFAHSPNYFWAVVCHDVPLGHIGNITAIVDEHNLTADLAILLGEPAGRGRGLGLEAWKRAVSFLLKDRRMRKVTAGTMAENVPMLGIMRAGGMIEEGRRRAQFLLDGKPVDLVMAAIFAEA